MPGAMRASPRSRFVKGKRLNLRRAVYIVLLFLSLNFLFTWRMYWFDKETDLGSAVSSQSQPWFPRRQWQRASRKVASILDGTAHAPSVGKLWLFLANGRPWDVAFERGCEAYFGNGFFKLIKFHGVASEKPGSPGKFMLRGEGAPAGEELPGWFRCRQNTAIKTSICEGGRVAMHTSRLQVSRGGEPVGSVIGRSDEEELPSFQRGTFEVVSGGGTYSRADARSLTSESVVNAIMPQGTTSVHILNTLLATITVVPTVNCTQVVREPTLFVTRYEYANLFHTSSDWYSAYLTTRISGFDAPLPIVFVDGHAQSPLDDCWRALFPNITQAKQLEGTVCYDHAIFVPLGYNTGIFEGVNTGEGSQCKGCDPGMEAYDPQGLGNSAGALQPRRLADDQKATARLREFGEVVSRAWGGDSKPWSWAKWKEGEMGGPSGTPLEDGERDLHVLFVRREDYLAHPRHSGQVEKRLDNEEEVLVALRFWAAEWAGVSNYNEIEASIAGEGGRGKRGGGRIVIENGRLAHMTFEEQIRAVHRAAVIVGAHGAGMTHLIFARAGTEIVEIVTPMFQRPHFQKLSEWRGDVHYQAITCSTQSVEPGYVVAVVRSIATRLLGRPPRLRTATG